MNSKTSWATFLVRRHSSGSLSSTASLGPLLLGGAVATFFDGSNFCIDKANLTNGLQPVISHWANASNGLDALLDPWNLVFGIAVLYLARVLGIMYIINNVNDDTLRARGRKQLVVNAIIFLVFFLTFLVRTLLKDGFAYDPATGVIMMEPMKYLHNLLQMWYLTIILLVGVVLLLFGLIKTAFCNTYVRGIWPAGIGVVLVVLVLLLYAGWNNTAYYPSNVDLQSSLTIANSCSSEFTLRTMAIVSIFIPFVLAYIVYAWYSIDKKKIDKDEIANDDAY
jgi:cytochrome d ubiquinol oxidase subunit II